ncbi:MAG: putative peptidase [Planctomycetaceae bacterium]|nr:putative peptidase [Planctomycetaceae bacterium]
MRLTSWLHSLRTAAFGVSLPRGRRTSQRLGRVTEVLEERTLLSASFSLELVHQDAIEGAAIGSGNTAEFIVHKTAIDNGGASAGVFLAISETGTAVATPDQDYQYNDYYFNLSDAGSPPIPATRNMKTGQLGIWVNTFNFAADGTARFYVVARQDNLVEGTENVHLQLVINSSTDMYHDTLGDNSALDLRILDATPIVTVTASDPDAREPGNGQSGDPGTFTFCRSGGDQSQSLTVNFYVSGTATNGVDYLQIPTSVTFAAHQSNVTLDVSPLVDLVDPGDEQAIVTLNPGSGYLVGTENAATVTIHLPLGDEDIRGVTISSTPGLAQEDNDHAGVTSQTFQITRSGGTTGDLTVNFSLSGTATNGTDYSQLPTGSVVIPGGQSSVSLVVTPIWDQVQNEGDETVKITLTSTSDTNFPVLTAGDHATITIRDANYPAVWISTSVADADEVTPQGNPGQLQMLVHVDRPSQHCSYPVTIPYTISTTDRDGVVMATNGVDYQSLSGSVTVGGTATSATINITTIWDTIYEPTETVELTLNPVGTQAYYTLGSSTTADARIHNVASAIVSLSVADAAAAEEGPNGGDPVPARLTFTRTNGDLSVPLAVSFSDYGMATLGVDFTGLSSPVTIPANQSSITILATPVWDTLKEGPIGADGKPNGIEDFNIHLISGPGYEVAAGQVDQQFTITDAPTPVISITASDSEAAEDDGTNGPNSGSWTISRTGGTTQPLVVTVSLSGTATSGTDYTTAPAVTSTVTIPVGSSSVSVQLNPIWNPELEPVAPDNTVPPQDVGKEKAKLTIFESSSYDVSPTQNQADIWIADAPLSTVTVAVSNPLASEQGGQNYSAQAGSFTFTRTGSLSQSLHVSLGINTGLSGFGYASSADYTFSPDISGGVTFPQGQSSVTVTVTPKQDQNYAEGDETLKLTIVVGSPQLYENGSPNGAQITIQDAPLPLVTVSVTSSFAKEEGTDGNPVPGFFVLNRTGDLSSALTVNCQTSYVTGSAAGGTDFHLVAGASSNGVGVGTFPIGVSRITVQLNPVWDDIVEGDETIKLQVTPALGYRTDSSSDSGQVTIMDRPVPWVSIDTVADAQEEGLTGDPVPGFIRISRWTGSNLRPLTVSFVIQANSTASAGIDYDGPILNGFAIIPAGQSYVDVSVNPRQDTDNQESTETVVAALTPSGKYQFTDPSTTLLIADSPSPRVQVDATDSTAAEPATGPADTGTFTVSRVGRSNQSLTVQLAVSGTATSGADFTSSPSLSGSNLTITFNPGELSKTITITPLADQDYQEGVENVGLTITPNSAYLVQLGHEQASVSIADAPNVMTVELFASVSETGEAVSNSMQMMGMPPYTPPPAVATLTRTGRTDQAVTVQVHVAGNATYGSDYTSSPAASGSTISVDFAPNEVTKTIQITAITDALVELEENVFLTISNTSAYHIGNRYVANLGIHDNHSTVTVLATDPFATEPSSMFGMPDNGTFAIQRVDGDLSQPLTVSFSLGGTASSTDYSAYSNYNGTATTVTIPAWQTYATVTLTPTADSLAEGLEIAGLTLASGPDYAVGVPDRDFINIGDSIIPTYIVTAPDADATEPFSTSSMPDTATFHIAKLGGSSSNDTVTFNFSGSATLYSDYSVSGYSLSNNYGGGYSISVGSYGADVTVFPNADNDWTEGNESVVLNLDDQFVSDQNSSFQQATITIHPAVNNPPTINGTLNSSYSMLEDSTGQAISFSVNDQETYPSALTVQATAVPAGLVNVNAYSMGMGMPGDRQLLITPVPNQNGMATVTITVTDGNGATATKTLQVQVTPVNDVPSFTGGSGATVNENAGRQTIANWASGISAGPRTKVIRPFRSRSPVLH